MRNVVVYPAHGGWMYAVWFAGRITVFGWKPTEVEAQHEANLA